MPFTVWDVVEGRLTRFRDPNWSYAECADEARRHATVPDPEVCVMDYPHLGLTTPQVIISQGALRNTHRAFVLSLQGRKGAEVVELPHGHTTLHALASSRRVDG